MKRSIRVSRLNLIWSVFLSRLSNRIAFFHFVGLAYPVSKTIYTKTSAKIQKVAKILKLGIVEVTPFVVNVPPFVGGLIAYFTTDLGADALELPLPMW